MKHLFRQFIHDIRNYEEDENLKVQDDSNNPQEVKIPAVQLFDELGKLFDRELRQTIFNQKNPKGKDGENNAPNQETEHHEESEFMNADSQVKSAQENMNRRI